MTWWWERCSQICMECFFSRFHQRALYRIKNIIKRMSLYKRERIVALGTDRVSLNCVSLQITMTTGSTLSSKMATMKTVCFDDLSSAFTHVSPAASVGNGMRARRGQRSGAPEWLVLPCYCSRERNSWEGNKWERLKDTWLRWKQWSTR